MKSDGALLGRFSEYLRVVRPRVRAELRLNKESFAAGDIVFARVENPGSVGIAYGPELRLEEPDGMGDWRGVPGTPTAWPGFATLIPGGSAGECEHIRLPSILAAGHYRISKLVNARSRKLPLYAPFSVGESG
jgi:hypothetical protein